MDIEVEGAVVCGPDLIETYVIWELGNRVHLHAEYTAEDIRQWKEICVDLPEGEKGVVRRVGNRLVQQKLTPVRESRTQRR